MICKIAHNFQVFQIISVFCGHVVNEFEFVINKTLILHHDEPQQSKIKPNKKRVENNCFFGSDACEVRKRMLNPWSATEF